jgi:hypothetical protein
MIRLSKNLVATLEVPAKNRVVILQKYESIFSEINIEIEKFNTLLAEECRISPLNASDSESCSVIANIPWDDQVWPHKDFPGVYILCAYHQSDTSRLGAYIGKASLKYIGHRLWAHLNPHRTTNIYRMNDLSGEPFIIEAIVAIGLRNPRMRVLASSLEESIIAGVREHVHLLNGTGNVA